MGGAALMTKRALVLFAHGARDPRWAEPFRRLQTRIQEQSPDIEVALGFLELMSPGLPELAAQLVQQQVSEITVVPVFLGRGGHVMRDLPQMVEELKLTYPQMPFRIAGAVGEDDDVLDAMASYCLKAAH